MDCCRRAPGTSPPIAARLSCRPARALALRRSYARWWDCLRLMQSPSPPVHLMHGVHLPDQPANDVALTTLGGLEHGELLRRQMLLNSVLHEPTQLAGSYRIKLNGNVAEVFSARVRCLGRAGRQIPKSDLIWRNGNALKDD